MYKVEFEYDGYKVEASTDFMELDDLDHCSFHYDNENKFFNADFFCDLNVEVKDENENIVELDVETFEQIEEQAKEKLLEEKHFKELKFG